MKTDPVRLRALDLLVRVDQGARLDALLDESLSGLTEPRDAALLAELVRGTLQWRERYRHVLSVFVDRRLPDDSALLYLLLMSLHQLLALDRVPPYAVLHQAGELCRRRVSEDKVPFVNGVLQAVRRRLLAGNGGGDSQASPVAERLQRLETLFDDLADDPVRRLAAWQSHPLWLVQRWVERFGIEAAAAICAADNQPLEIWLHVLPPADPDETARLLATSGWPTAAGATPRTLRLRERSGQAELRDMLERFPALIVQDATVQEATGWLLEARSAEADGPPWDRPDRVILDMCAAPGGKTVRLAAGWPGPQPLLAMDTRPGRLALLQDTIRRTGQGRIVVLAGDGLDPPLPAGSCAAVLLDGPCSGTGVLRHHPEGRWQLNRRTPRRNGQILLGLARRAAELLAPGGLLLYATCSLEAEENQDVLQALLAERSDLAPVPDGQGRWQRQWLPGAAPGDGFFAARLCKTPSHGGSGS